MMYSSVYVFGNILYKSRDPIACICMDELNIYTIHMSAHEDVLMAFHFEMSYSSYSKRYTYAYVQITYICVHVRAMIGLNAWRIQ